MARPSDSRDRILETAAELWHQRSYDGVGVAEICAEAGVLKGSFYHFFESKEALVLAVLDRHWTMMREHLLEPAFATDVPPLARFERLLKFMGEGIAREHREGPLRGCPVGNLGSELGTRDETVRERVAEIFDGVRGFFRRALKDAVAAGELSGDTDVTLGAASLVTYFQGLAVIGKAYDNPRLLRKLAKQMYTLAGATA